MVDQRIAGRRPVAIDLFSGAGGLSLGFESAGFDVISAVEYDPVHAATHLYNFPLTDVLCRDIATISKDDILASAQRGWQLHHQDEAWDGIVDVVMGGPSCQGFSTMGKQDADDSRNKLLSEFVRIVELVRPRAFCIENVPGLLDSRFDEIRLSAISRLRKAGYEISGEDTVLRAEDFGVPQKRRRVVILGIRDSEVAPVRPRPSAAEPFTVADAFAALPQLSRYSGLQGTDVIKLSSEMVAKRSSFTNDYLRLADALGNGSSAYGYPRMIDASELTGCKLTVHSPATAARFKATPQGKKEPKSRLHKLSTSGQALTLRAGTGRERGAFSAARPLHPTIPRVITVREAARLHSFPDWFRFHTTNWHGHRQIGNAVPPLLAYAAATAVIESLGVPKSKVDAAPTAFGPKSLLSLTPTEAAIYFGIALDQVPHRRRPEATLVAV